MSTASGAARQEITIMRRVFLRSNWMGCVIVCLAASSSLLAAPKICSQEPEFKFGVKQRTDEITAKFTVANDGDQPLEIKRVICSWNGALAKPSATTLAPGAEATITVTCVLKKCLGPIRRDVIVESNDPNHSRFLLRLTGEVASPVTVEPGTLAFGKVNLREGITRTVTLTAESSKTPFRVATVKVRDPEVFSARVEEVEAGNLYKVHVRILPNALPTDVQSVIRIETDNPKVGTLTLPVTAQLNGKLVLSPAHIDAFSTPGGSLPPQAISLSSADGKPFKITAVEVPLPSIEAKVVSAGPGGYRITLNNLVPSRDLDGKFLVIKTNVDGMGELRVPVRFGHAHGSQIKSTISHTGVPKTLSRGAVTTEHRPD